MRLMRNARLTLVSLSVIRNQITLCIKNAIFCIGLRFFILAVCIRTNFPVIYVRFILIYKKERLC